MGDFEKVAYYVRREEDPLRSCFRVRRADANGPNFGEEEIEAFSAEEAITLASRPRVRDDFPRMFTEAEMVAAVKAVAFAENGADRTIMGHIRGDKKVSPETADAIRKIVVGAYVEMLVGE